MSLRMEFVLRVLEPGSNMSALCRRYGITRRTGYKWLRRYQEHGFAGLEELSRGPRRGRSPLRCSADIAAAVIRLRRDYPNYGPKKLHAVLARSFESSELPSARTIGRILERAGMQAPRRPGRRRRTAPNTPPSPIVDRPNDVWSVDFKGWWRTKTNTKVEPLTVQDRYSRFVLCARILKRPTYKEVRAAFETLFEDQGLPRAIQTDGGPPFAATSGVIGLSRLSAWWVALGIEWHRSRPGCPQDNGGHERMHLDMALDLERHPAWDRLQQQDHCDLWRHTFNHHRPHEALAMQTPNDVYRPSRRLHTTDHPELDYPPHMHRRKVSAAGTVRYLGPQQYISIALAGHHVGFEPRPEQGFRVWFGSRCIALGTLPWTQPLRPAPPGLCLPAPEL